MAPSQLNKVNESENAILCGVHSLSFAVWRDVRVAMLQPSATTKWRANYSSAKQYC